MLTYGWPISFVEYLPLVPLLTDPAAHGIDGSGFDVVIPSLPGYGLAVATLRQQRSRTSWPPMSPASSPICERASSSSDRV